jgi:CheY-like chemotaxis protein
MNGFPAPDGAVPAGPPILLVDDEVAILDGLRRQLRRKVTVHTATGGAEALRLLESESVTVVVSDMRMPGMDGATLLSLILRQHPEIVRILLTGQADDRATIAAVSEGRIFRFLTKPCPPEVLIAELDSAIALHRLVTADKELLPTMLRGSVESLTATLPRSQPALLAPVVRIHRIVSELAQALEADDPSEIELTSMLAHLGAVTLPPTVLAKLEAGRPLNEHERAMDGRVIGLSRDLLAAIPGWSTSPRASAYSGPVTTARDLPWPPPPEATCPGRADLAPGRRLRREHDAAAFGAGHDQPAPGRRRRLRPRGARRPGPLSRRRGGRLPAVGGGVDDLWPGMAVLADTTTSWVR